MRTEGATKMTPLDDQLASLLAEVGYSNRQIAGLMGRDDKTVAAGVERSRTHKSAFTVPQEARARQLLGFLSWMEEGKRKGYIKALAAQLT